MRKYRNTLVVFISNISIRLVLYRFIPCLKKKHYKAKTLFYTKWGGRSFTVKIDVSVFSLIYYHVVPSNKNETKRVIVAVLICSLKPSNMWIRKNSHLE